MSTALIRDIRSALFDFGRPLPEDVTLTTAVRELIAAVSESEDDLLRAEVERDKLATDLRDLRNTTASLRADLAEAQAMLARQPAVSATGPAAAFVIIAGLALLAYLATVIL